LDSLLMLQKGKQYTVKENAVKGVYVSNLNEVDCPTLESAYLCLLKGLMRKRVSQTIRNTSSSRSHTIFQIKLYLKPI
jgi:kinesin family protein 23